MGNFKERAKAFFSPHSMTFSSTTSLGKRASDDSQSTTARNSGSSVAHALKQAQSWTSNNSHTNPRSPRPEASHGWFSSRPRKHREPALFQHGDFVYYMPETIQLGVKRVYWIAGRLYDPENGYYRYFLRYVERPDGVAWGWAAEPALRRAGQKGLTSGGLTDQPFEVIGHGLGGLGVL